MGEATASSSGVPLRQRLNVERITPALVMLGQGASVSNVAARVGVSTTTVLAWMDWCYSRRDEVEANLQAMEPGMTPGQRGRLWERIERRQTKRQRRLGVRELLKPRQ